jgi:hypothetical protein
MPRIIKERKRGEQPYTIPTCETGSTLSRCNLCDPCKKKKDINACRFDRNSQTITKKIHHGPIMRDGEVLYCVMNTRFLYIPLYQEGGISRDKILKDLVFDCSLSVYNGKKQQELLDDDGNKFQLEYLRSVMHFRIVLIQICDPVLAKKKDLLPSDVFVNLDDDESETCEGIVLLCDGYTDLETSKDEFEEFRLRMCHKFNDEPVCICTSEQGENLVFDKGVFALFVYIKYIPSAMSIRKLVYDSNDSELYRFGKEFDYKGNVGYSVIINGLDIEESYEEVVGDGLSISEHAIREIFAKLKVLEGNM